MKKTLFALLLSGPALLLAPLCAQDAFAPIPEPSAAQTNATVEDALRTALADTNATGAPPLAAPPGLPVPARARRAPTAPPAFQAPSNPAAAATPASAPQLPAAAATSPAAPVPGPMPAVPAAAPAAPAVAIPPEAQAPGEQLIAITPPPPSTNAVPEEVLPAGVINFPATDLNQVLEIYAELVGRTVLRPTTLPAATITLKTRTPLTKREAIQAFDAVLALNGIAVVNVGEKFVKVIPTAQAGQVGAAFSSEPADRFPELGKYVTHIVQLTYAKPAEVVAALTPFASAGMANGILPIESSQILILRDFSENVKRMLEMTKRIDVAVPAEFISEVIPIKYALAAEIANALGSLGAGGGGVTVGGGGTGTGMGTGMRTGTGFGRGTGTGMGMGMGSGGYGSYGRGGYPGYGGYGTQAVGTQQANPQPGASSSFTDRLRNLIKGAPAQGDIQVIGQTKIIADERTNSLLIFASREDMKTIKDIISKLDIVLAQVLIEAVIIEVQLGDSKDFGFTYVGKNSSGSYNGFGTIGTGNTPFYDPGSFVSGGGSNALSAFRDGFNYLARFNDDLSVVVRAVESDSRARILQRPRVQTSNAKPAMLFVGELRPYPTGSYYGGGAYGGYSSIQQIQIGVSLEVTPLINPEGLVVMEIHQKIDNVSGEVRIDNVGLVPVTSSKEATASVAVRDQDTIMLGGLIETSKKKSGSGVPFLMDVPLLGFFFRSTSMSEVRNELIVLIRPTVLPTPEIAALAAQSVQSRMPGVRRAEEEFRKEQQRREQSYEESIKTQ